MKIVSESTGWERAGDVVVRTEGSQDIYTCTITTWQVEANLQRYKLMEDSLVAVIRPKPKFIPNRWWRAMLRWLISFERINQVGSATEAAKAEVRDK